MADGRFTILGVEIELVIEPGLAAAQDIGALLFGGVRRPTAMCVAFLYRNNSALHWRAATGTNMSSPLTQSLELYDTCRPRCSTATASRSL
ncbi:hypothetical protein [Mesorhizobium sp. M1295]|uniref:hypothetical protein n=1 Tax=Mesorhizobium sp. M1295 TaxID=2957076 RepID=UPI0033357ECA